MTAHLHYIKNAVQKTLSQMKEDLETSMIGRGDPLGPTTLDLRQVSMTFDHNTVLVRRLYLEVNDSSTLSSVGWVTNESTPMCMECLKNFSLLTRRHHCRACGMIVCGECCKGSCLIKDFPELGYQRVCHKCNPNVSEKRIK